MRIEHKKTNTNTDYPKTWSSSFWIVAAIFNEDSRILLNKPNKCRMQLDHFSPLCLYAYIHPHTRNFFAGKIRQKSSFYTKKKKNTNWIKIVSQQPKALSLSYYNKSPSTNRETCRFSSLCIWLHDFVKFMTNVVC